MAYEVIPTESFEREYDSIIRYHLEVLKAPQAASKLIDELDKAYVKLSDNPLLNAVSRKPVLEEFELREQLVRNYVIVYRVDGDLVYLEHMFHQTQDFECLA